MKSKRPLSAQIPRTHRTSLSGSRLRPDPPQPQFMITCPLQDQSVPKAIVTHRPQSAMQPRYAQDEPLAARLKDYRISQYEVYAGIKGNILGTFNPSENKLYKEIKDLNKGLSPSHAKVLDKMLQKFCVKIDRKKSKIWQMPINSQAIQNSYIRAKSRQKQHQQSRQLTKSDIRRVALTPEHGNPTSSFFDYSIKGIAQFQKLSHHKSSSVHPIVNVFNKKSAEVIDSYRRGELEQSKAKAIYDEYPDERFEENQFKFQKFQREKELKELNRRVADIRNAKRNNPKKPLISNIT